MSMRKRVSDEGLDRLIENDGTVDGFSAPSATGALRLALDLREARSALASVRTELLSVKTDGDARRVIQRILEGPLRA